MRLETYILATCSRDTKMSDYETYMLPTTILLRY